MLRRTFGRFLPGSVVVAVCALALAAAGAALAATTWTVKPGGSVTGTAGTTTWKDTKTGTVLTCTSSKLSGTLKHGSGLSGAGIGFFSALSFSKCTGPLGLSFTATVEKLPYKLNAVSYSSGVTKGTISGFFAHLSGSGCSLSVAGTNATAPGAVTARYANNTGVLSTSGGTLHIWNVSGCFGLIGTGDPAILVAKYTVTPKQTITSP